MKKESPLRAWLRLLGPDVHRMAIANLDSLECGFPRRDTDAWKNNLQEAINRHATWSQTPQGHDFWMRKYEEAGKNTRTPDDFIGIDCTIPEELT